MRQYIVFCFMVFLLSLCSGQSQCEARTGLFAGFCNTAFAISASAIGDTACDVNQSPCSYRVQCLSGDQMRITIWPAAGCDNGGGTPDSVTVTAGAAQCVGPFTGCIGTGYGGVTITEYLKCCPSSINDHQNISAPHDHFMDNLLG
eukprot:358656_1